MKFRPIFIVATTALLSAASVWGVPAKRAAITVHQPDGTALTLTLTGDEYCHYYLTEDHQAVIERDGAYYFATTAANGALTASDVLASGPESRTAEQSQFLAGGLDLRRAVSATREHSALYRGHLERKDAAMAATGMSRAASSPSSGIGLFPNWHYPRQGEVRAAVILVEYKNVSFIKSDEDTYDYFNRMLNEPGFSEEGGQGSARDYFETVSCGQFLPTFDVYGPVTLPYSRSYYGGDDFMGQDKNPWKMVTHAVDQLVEDGVDFSIYDNDGDGVVDNVFVFYAGVGEAVSGLTEAVWPHTYNLRNVSNNGKGHEIGDNLWVDNYACSCELIDSKGTMRDGIGTFVHEFSHVLGLPDLYNTEDGTKDYTPRKYDLLDGGSYNEDSRVPPAYSSFERNAVGWIELDVIDDTMDLELQPLLASNQAYILPTAKETEFFLFEYRTQEGWDSSIPYHGMLVWHIDYDEDIWHRNAANNDESHQCVDLIEACGKTAGTKLWWERYPFPGKNGKYTSLSYDTNPSLRTWDDTDLGFVFTDITEADGLLKAKVTNKNSGIIGVVGDNLAINIDGRTISVDGAQQVMVFDTMGRVVSRGNGSVTVSQPGIYIVKADGRTSKIAIK